MREVGFVSTVVLLALAGCSQTLAASQAPDTYEGLYKVKAKRFDVAYLAPNVDFGAYGRVQIDPVRVAFRRNWQRDYNASSASLSRRISDADAQKILDMATDGFMDILAEEFRRGGYEVTPDTGPDVLTVQSSVIDLDVNAPDTMSPGRTVSFAREAGHAKLVLEVRDSRTGAILGRVVDRRTIGDNLTYRRDMVTNKADFERQFRQWARGSVDALDDLRATPQVTASVPR